MLYPCLWLQVRCQELDGRERSVQTQVATAQHMTASARPEDVAQVTDKIKRLRDRWQDTRERAIKRKVSVRGHGLLRHLLV